MQMHISKPWALAAAALGVAVLAMTYGDAQPKQDHEAVSCGNTQFGSAKVFGTASGLSIKFTGTNGKEATYQTDGDVAKANMFALRYCDGSPVAHSGMKLTLGVSQ